MVRAAALAMIGLKLRAVFLVHMTWPTLGMGRVGQTCLPKDQVAHGVSLPCLDEGHISGERFFQNTLVSPKDGRLRESKEGWLSAEPGMTHTGF